MTEVAIKNRDILDILEYVRSSVFDSKIVDQEYANPYRTCAPEEARHNPTKFLSEDFLKIHMEDENHEGFPVEHSSIPVEHFMKESEDTLIKNVYDYVRGAMVTDMGANCNAVFLYYPPGGFVGWHNNSNNSGIQFIFTYSEGGDGYFQYYDKQKQEIVVTNDSPGWRCHYHHFGKDEPDHCWHSAYTNEPRITVCVLFRWWDKPELEQQVRDMAMELAEEIQED